MFIRAIKPDKWPLVQVYIQDRPEEYRKGDARWSGEFEAWVTKTVEAG